MSMDEFVKGLESMDPAELALGAGLLGILATLVLVGGVVWYFLSAIGYRKMFIKAGEAGWKAFVPYYKHYICFKFAWNTKAFWPFIITLCCLQALPNEAGLLITLVNIACIVVHIIFAIKLDVRIAKSFGKTKGWGVLLFFFPFVVSLILGYGKAEYINNATCIE